MTTLVRPDDAGPTAAVNLPPGWVRVWTGPVLPGDRYLDRTALLAGRVEWVRLGAAEILADATRDCEPIYDTAGWFTCLTREGRRDVGRPCPACGHHGDDRTCAAPEWV